MDMQRQRWKVQFTLRRLLVATAVAGIALTIVAHEVLLYRRSQQVAAEIVKRGGVITWSDDRFRDLVKGESVARILEVYFRDPQFDAQDWETLSRIPHNFVLVVEGKTFGPADLSTLAPIPNLDHLFLMSTSVEASDVQRFQKERPDVFVAIGAVGATVQEFPADRP